MPTDEELKQPQRFPLTGDGLVTQRVIASGPLNGPGSDIGEELALARYNDHQFAQERVDRAVREVNHASLHPGAKSYWDDNYTERRSTMPDAEAERQADAYWESLINRSRQTEQNAQAYAAAQRQAAPERAEQLPLETPKMVLTQ
jgi:hypothetical protein